MDQTLIDLAVFLAGAVSGAALCYWIDRQLLRLYGDLARQLSSALQEQAEHMPHKAGAPPQWVVEPEERVRETSAS